MGTLTKIFDTLSILMSLFPDWLSSSVFSKRSNGPCWASRPVTVCSGNTISIMVTMANVSVNCCGFDCSISTTSPTKLYDNFFNNSLLIGCSPSAAWHGLWYRPASHLQFPSCCIVVSFPSPKYFGSEKSLLNVTAAVVEVASAIFSSFFFFVAGSSSDLSSSLLVLLPPLFPDDGVFLLSPAPSIIILSSSSSAMAGKGRSRRTIFVGTRLRTTHLASNGSFILPFKWVDPHSLKETRTTALCLPPLIRSS